MALAALGIGATAVALACITHALEVYYLCILQRLVYFVTAAALMIVFLPGTSPFCESPHLPPPRDFRHGHGRRCAAELAPVVSGLWAELHSGRTRGHRNTDRPTRRVVPVVFHGHRLVRQQGRPVIAGLTLNWSFLIFSAFWLASIGLAWPTKTPESTEKMRQGSHLLAAVEH